MTEKIGTALDEFEIEEFLESAGLGVLGLARDGAAYTIPIAFAYDEGNNRCILRFVMGQDSKKAAFAEATRTASLTVYDWDTPEAWRSVVLVGTLSELDTDDVATAAALFADVGEEAALDIFNRPLEEYETAWYEFKIAEVTGRSGL
jgi:nitroimidazol reductase NimA-like FMN-containing flavoprotein (pyridoxamine 5'-phosphate oxidase superfamily)